MKRLPLNLGVGLLKKHVLKRMSLICNKLDRPDLSLKISSLRECQMKQQMMENKMPLTLYQVNNFHRKSKLLKELISRNLNLHIICLFKINFKH